jgi:hypothetical protein
MIVGAVVGVSLVVSVAFEPNLPPTLGNNTAATRMSSQQKDAEIQPLLRLATDCIIHAVAADPRYHVPIKSGDINELIVTSMTVCIEPVRAMIHAHDRLFGEGTGAAFFMGPYLDVLPTAVTKRVSGGL